MNDLTHSPILWDRVKSILAKDEFRAHASGFDATAYPDREFVGRPPDAIASLEEIGRSPENTTQ
jgi:hypothetical protein